MLYIKISIVELCMARLDYVQMEHPPLSQLSGRGGEGPPLLSPSTPEIA
jgi:hypothetical protein